MNPIVEFFRKPIPRETLEDLHDIPYERFKLLGFDTFIFDYDNTLAPFRRGISDEVVELCEKLMKMGFKIAVVTNAPFERTKELRAKLPNVLVFAKARKPGLRILKVAVRMLKTVPSRTVFVGDLFFTDTIAGNRLGMYTILVEPYPGAGFLLGTLAFLEKVSYNILFYTFGWLFRTAELVSPNEWKKTVFDINYDLMISRGVKLFVFDMDNTVARWRADRLDSRTLELLRELSEKAKVVILSNGKSNSLNWVARNADIEVVRRAHKPLKGKMLRIMKKYRVSKSEVVVVGDQLFTDVLMASLTGLYSVKVEPIAKEEILFTKFLRGLEKMIRPFIKEKPSIKSEKDAWENLKNR